MPIEHDHSPNHVDASLTTASSLDIVREVQEDRRFNRTPRPYFRDGDQVQQDDNAHSVGRSGLPRQEQDGTIVHGELQPREDNWDRSQWHRQSGQASLAGSESGTEADDERPHFAKSLPPAALRPRKGLKTGEENADVLLTPSQLDDEGRQLHEDYWGKSQQSRPQGQPSEDESRAEHEKLQRRRLAEFLRRSSEVALMGVLTICVLCGHRVGATAWVFGPALLCHAVVVAALILAYPLKLSIVDTRATHNKLWERFRVPASFDPATVLYPPLLPGLVALAVSPNNPDAVLPNLVLGLSSLPQRLFPRSSRLGGFNTVHWIVTILPLVAVEFWPFPSPTSISSLQLSPETLVSLYPLHHALLLPLSYITQTSLLISELHLLSVALINLLLLAKSPQIVILKACLWIGGATIFVFCGPILRWNLTLVRVPRWKLRRDGHPAGGRHSLIDAVTALINVQRAVSAFGSGETVESDADEDEPPAFAQDQTNTVLQLKTSGIPRTNFEPRSALEPRRCNSGRRSPIPHRGDSTRPRRNTLPEKDHVTYVFTDNTSRSRSRRKPTVYWYLQLTPNQVQQRKWIYAAYFYLVAAVVVLGPVQYYVFKKALAEQNPILWAVSYMGGQLSHVRSVFDSIGLTAWVPWPNLPPHDWSSFHFTWPLDVGGARAMVGEANTRLLLAVYWAAVLLVGLLTVFNLTAFVEVDTRRKVFHGVMVAMLLPSVFVDPCCCALALTLVLTVFLLLEVIRAGQVLPLGNAIGRFVAPYVDGRDLRGPVVVSHIFLLVGCAVPLWFSLASILREGNEPWVDWELVSNRREVAMIAGVICVGMGDAAASLIGRRYGKHKWPWVGGKSLEGSAAFALAVTIGLVAAKIWQVAGGWQDSSHLLKTHAGENGVARLVVAWTVTTIKAVFCACGASFMEAVLTGANDNVVVPIALWLFVKGCAI